MFIVPRSLESAGSLFSLCFFGRGYTFDEAMIFAFNKEQIAVKSVVLVL